MSRSLRPTVLVAGVAAVALAGCGLSEPEPDLVSGKRLFAERCGSCHVLERAGSKGRTGPNLDEAFHRSIADGMERSTLEGVVDGQIDIPYITPESDVQGSESRMPADLVEGQDRRDVAAYVAYAAARPGEDTGALANAVPQAEQTVAEAENGELEIPADPNGQLIFLASEATAPAGPLSITSPNEASVPHNIALEGNGLDEIGPVVQNGGVSKIEVTVEAGEYTFYCSVPGHREAGMLGTLTVE